jgi:hypothetical protein
MLSYLPYNIRYVILDYLDYRDISNLKKAIQYPILDGYWRSRAAVYLIGEMNEIVEDDLNWEYLCMEIEKIDDTTDIFRSRYHILRILGDIKPGSLQNVDRRVLPHIKEVIYDGRRVG